MSRSPRRCRPEHLPYRRREPQIEAMEQRLLLSVSGIASAVEYLVGEGVSAAVTMHAPLSGREGGPAGPENAPVFTGFPPVILGEDNNDFYLDLTTAFQNAGGGTAGLQFQVVSTSNGQLFTGVTVEGSRLRLDLARHAFGESTVRIRATDATTQFVEANLPLTVLPVNDRPMTTGLVDLTLAPNQTRIAVNLFEAFWDIEDDPQELTYSITQNTRPELFESITIDPTSGLLLIHVKPGIQGTSTLTLRATDTEGAYVEMTNRGTQFHVYDAIVNPTPAVTELGLHRINLAGNAWLFETDSQGNYLFDHFHEANFRRYLNSQFYDPNLPLVIALESPYFENTPSGREMRADVLRVLWDERPEAIHAGFYSYLPSRSWHDSVDWRRAQEDTQRDLSTWYAQSHDDFRRDNLNWQQDNALWRTSPLADGSFVSDYITAIYPSLYTFYRDGHSSYAGPLIVDVNYSGQSGEFWLTDLPIANGLEVRFNRSHLDQIPTGFSTFTSYYVVNANGSSFQLSATPGGAPLPLNLPDVGTHYLEIVGPRNYTLYDPDVVYWRYYIEEHVAEARKFNVPVSLYLSPAFRGLGQKYLDETFFRMQLDLAYELADSVTIYDPGLGNITAPQNLGWYHAMSDFLQYLRHPTQFEITVDTSGLPADETRLRGVNGPRVDRFTMTAFAAAIIRQSETHTLLRPDSQGPTQDSDIVPDLVLPPILARQPDRTSETSTYFSGDRSWARSIGAKMHFVERDDASDYLFDEIELSNAATLAKLLAAGYPKQVQWASDRTGDEGNLAIGKDRDHRPEAGWDQGLSDDEQEQNNFQVSVESLEQVILPIDADKFTPDLGSRWRGRRLRAT